MAKKNTNAARALFLVGGFVEDLISGLPHYKAGDIEVIRIGIRICKKRKEKTKVGHLERKLKKLNDELKGGA